MIRKSVRALIWGALAAIVGNGVVAPVDLRADDLRVSEKLAYEKKADEPFRYYFVSATVESLDESRSLSSYRGNGMVSGMPGSTLGLGTKGAEISISPVVESNHFYADVVIKRTDGKASEDEKKERVDLTDLRVTSIEVGKDRDGRTYVLNLVPSVKTENPTTPKPFREIANDLYQLNFHASTIVLNDKQYVGRMLASGGEKLSVEICGVANVEFSLRRLKGAEPWGRLQNGRITMSNPDRTSIEIGNVTNGSEDRVVEGGPYTVWVRWSKAQQTAEEFRADLKANRDVIKGAEGAENPQGTVAQMLAIIDQELAREPGPWVTNCGACGVAKEELVGEE